MSELSHQLEPAAPPAPPGPAARDSWRSRHRFAASLTRGAGLAGVVLVAMVCLAGLFAPLLTSWDPVRQVAGSQLLPPGAGHLFGTDQLSRDIAARVFHGARTSLLVAVIAVPAGTVLGILIGLLATTRPLADLITQRVFDVVLAFPALILGVLLALVAGPGTPTVITVIVVTEAPIVGRLIRSQVLRVRELPFVESARVIGAPGGWVLRRHVLPNSLEPVAVHVALAFSGAIFAESAMSFLGIGVRPPAPSLGGVIADSLLYIEIRPWFAVAPLAVVVALSVGFYLIAQALGKAGRD
ncbi:ABC transporter permease [Amycolatopsis thermoflava]|uniref:ABC transporter permease n=1 Tax=Amycolatopsis thermoflava TaxID=84480 RepID=UPI00041B1BD4|nr:ABC transporter permease [Amycolatopsis thermoflava]